MGMLLGALLALTEARAQTISATTYPFSATSGVALEDMSSGTTTLVGPNLDGGVSAVTPIGFDFWFTGSRQTQFSVNSNGLLKFGSTAVSIASSNAFSTVADLPLVAPYWDDLWTGTNGKVHSKVVGTAPDRRLVVEWQNLQVPRVGTGLTGAATWQCWLYEATGAIDFVYGSGMAVNTAQAGASIGLAATGSMLASVSANTSTVSYTVANNGNTSAIPAGTRYRFAPPTPAAPSNLAFSGVTAVATTLQWSDVATDEVGYVLWRSTDGVNYTFVTQLPANTTSTTQSGLAPATTYSWRLQAVGEGALSSAASGSQATLASGQVTTQGSGGWASTVPGAPWPGGILPTASDVVVIADGHTVTVDTAATCYDLVVGEGASGVLVFESVSARTLSVGHDVTLLNGAQLRAASSGTQTGHVLSVAGSLSNAGTLDLSANGGAAGVTLLFTSASGGATLSGSGAVTDLYALSLDKGTGPSEVLSVSPTVLTVRDLATGGPGFVTLTNGTLRLAGTYTLANPLFPSPTYVIGAETGLWLDNPNLTVTGQAGSCSHAGLLRVSQGMFVVGTSANHAFQLFNGSTVRIEGGSLQVAGRFAVQSTVNRVQYVQSGGALVVPTVGNTSTTLASFDLGTLATSSVDLSGGRIVLQTPSGAASGPRDFRNSAGIQAITGGTLQLGNEATPAASVFRLTGTGPGLGFTTATSGHVALLAANFTAGSTSTLAAGDTLKLNGFRFAQAGGDLVNHGNVASTSGNSELAFSGSGIGQSYSGSGVVNVPLQGLGLTIDNPAGVTLSPTLPANLVTHRVNLARGTLLNSQWLTVGVGDTNITATIQRGAAGQTDPAGTFDVAPVINLGPSGLALVYAQASTPTLTALEVPTSRSVRSLTMNSSSGMVVSGGNLTVTNTLTLTSGIIASSATSTLRLASTLTAPPAGSAASHVDGPLAIEVSSGTATNRTFAVGNAGAYRPLQLKSVNTGGVARVFTAQVVPGATGGTPTSPLLALTSTRYWRVQNAAALNATARVNLTFGADDNIGTLANARVSQSATVTGSYASLGGVTTGTATAGTVESNVNLVPGSEFFAIGSIGALASNWDGGAGTNNWSDAANWTPDGVPTATTVVALSAATPVSLSVNGSFSTSNLTVGSNVSLAVGTGALTVTGTFTQVAGSVTIGSGSLSVSGTSTLSGGALQVDAGLYSSTGALAISGGAASISGIGSIVSNGNFTLSAGSIGLGAGTLEVKGNFSRTGGLFTAGTGTTLFSGTNIQQISTGVTHYNVVLRNGGLGKPKRFESVIPHTISNDFTVENTAQLGLTTADETHFSVFGSLGYSGIAGGTGVSSIRIDLRGTGRTISGAGGGTAALQAVSSGGASAIPVPLREPRRHRLLTDPSRGVWLPDSAGGRPRLQLEHTLARERGMVQRLLATAAPEDLVVIDLDDATIIRNPESFGSLKSSAPSPTAVAPGTSSATAISALPMPVMIEYGADYSLAENVTLSSAQSLGVGGRLRCGGFTVGGAGFVQVVGGGVLMTTANNPAGLGATVLTTGANNYFEGAIIEYSAAGPQTISATYHPASAMVHTSGSGTKTFVGDKTFTAGTGFELDNGVIRVGAGTTFADGGSLLSFGTSLRANVVVEGSYVSTGNGGLSFEAGAFDSRILAPDGTGFGSLAMNFMDSSYPVELNASGTAQFTFRKVVFGGAGGSGTAGGTLRMGQTGTTHVVVTDSVFIVPRDSSQSGGGFAGSAGKASSVTLRGAVRSTSRAAQQPLVNGVGINTLVFGGTTGPQALAYDSSATLVTSTAVVVDNPEGLVLQGTARRLSLGSGSSLALGAAPVVTGDRVLALAAGVPVTRTSGRIVGRLQKPVAGGSGASATFEVGTATEALPVTVSFGNVSVPGTLEVSSALGEHPQVGASGIDTLRSVNRYWTIVPTGLAFDSAAVALDWPAGALDAASVPDSLILRRYRGSQWAPTTPGPRTATGMQASGLTAFGDLVVGHERLYALTASAGGNGAITPSGGTIVGYGGSQTYTLVPDTGYIVSQVVVDGVAIDTTSSYTFTSVSAPHDISVSFVRDPRSFLRLGAASGIVTLNDSIRTVPVLLSRFMDTPVRAFHVELTLGAGLTLANLIPGSFLTVDGVPAQVQWTDNGGGHYTVDGLAASCGASSTSDTLFALGLASSLGESAANVTLDVVTLSDCLAAAMPVVLVAPGTGVVVDRLGPTVVVTAPGAGQVWIPGSERWIEWTATDTSGVSPQAVDVEFSADGGANWSAVASGLAVQGSHEVTVPDSLGEDARYRVTVEDTHGNRGSGVSSAFAIKRVTSLSLTSAPNPSVFGDTVTLTATMTPSAASGTVEFLDGAVSLGTSALVDGVATLATNALSGGAHDLTAVYSGDPFDIPDTSGVVAQLVERAASAVTMASSPNPSVFGDTIIVTATVTPSVASGTVEFLDGTFSLGTATLVDGVATLATSALSGGSHSLTAVYSGDTDHLGATSAISAHTVERAASAVAVTSSPNPSAFGGSVTLTATMTPSVAIGTVEFFDGEISLGTASLAGGTASIATSAFTVGSHDLSAVYSGDTDHTGDTSTVSVHVVDVATPSVAVSSSPNPSVLGGSVTLTATVTPSTASGTVEFFDGALSLGTASLAGGTASIATSALAVGVHDLTAVYSGDTSYSGSASAASAHTVERATSSVAVASSPNPSAFGDSVTVTATVTPSVASGTVEFFDGAVSLGTASLAGGTASISASGFSGGSHSLTAVYSGDTNYSGSASAVSTHTVERAASAVTMASSPNPSVFGDTIIVTATVTPSVASGTVEFLDGTFSLGTATLVDGVATLATSALSGGEHSLTAVYSGDTDHLGATSAISAHTVERAASAVAVTSSPNPSAFGGSVTLTATVTPSVAIGTVEFFDGAVSLGTASLAGGTASIATSAFTVGSHDLSVVYSGDKDHTGDTSTVSVHVVDRATPSVTVSSSPNPSAFGGSVTLTATVTPSAASGTVEFFDGAVSLGTAGIAGGTASIATSTFSMGSHDLSAVYSGDTDYTAAASAVSAHVVGQATPVVTLASSPNPSALGESVTLTATVAPSTASGTVEFLDGAVSLGTATLVDGVATLATSTLTVGTHSLTAAYGGATQFVPAVSASLSLEVRAIIVASAGPNGGIAPSGTTYHSLGSTPTFAFTADAGYHISAITVDGAPVALANSYTFAPVSSLHTLAVEFALNPSVASITNLTASQVRNGNDPDGRVRISLAWSGVPAGSTVEVWRKGFGNYPLYDDGVSPGSVPVSPVAYPPAGWTLTSVAATGGMDKPSTRDVHYYIAYVTDAYGTRSAVSNMTAGTLDYVLGDVSDGVSVAAGDNLVNTADLSVLGSHYGLRGAEARDFAFLDVGPTLDKSGNSRPTTDNRINFEDLVIFALNWSPTNSVSMANASSGPGSAGARADHGPAAAEDRLEVEAPARVRRGETFEVRVRLAGTGRVHAASLALGWDDAVVRPVSVSAGEFVSSNGGVLFSAAPGEADLALLGAESAGFVGQGEVAVFRFEALEDADPGVHVASVSARDHLNRPVALPVAVAASPVAPLQTALSLPMPNPFRESVSVVLSLARAGQVQVEVYSVTGRRVRTVVERAFEAGVHRFTWDGLDDQGRDAGPGIYFVRTSADRQTITRRVTLVR